MADGADVLVGVKAFGPLRDWMRDDGITQIALANAMGKKQQTVSGWCLERMRPKTEQDRIKLEMLSGGRVKRDLWLNAKERKALVGVRPMAKTGTGEG